MNEYLSSHRALAEIGSRLKTYRIDSSMTQEDLAMMAGVSRRSIQNLEKGEDIKFGTLMKVLIALKLDSNIDLLVPDPTKRPSYYMNKKAGKHQLQRVTKKKISEKKSPFKWGDEE